MINAHGNIFLDIILFALHFSFHQEKLYAEYLALKIRLKEHI